MSQRGFLQKPDYRALLNLWNKAYEERAQELNDAYWKLTDRGGKPEILEAALAQFGYYLEPPKEISGINEAAEEFEDYHKAQEIMEGLS